MFRKIIVSIIVFGFAAPAFAQIASPPSDDLVDQLKEAGFNESYYYPASALLAAEMLVKSERLSRSGTEVYRTTQKITDAGYDVSHIDTYIEVIRVPNFGPDGRTVELEREMNPETLARRRAETLGPGEANEVLAVGLQAYGEGLLLVGSTLSQLVRESDWGAATVGSRAAVNQSGEEATNPGLYSNSYGCALALTGLNKVSVPDPDPDKPNHEFSANPWESVDPFYFLLGPACMVIAVAERMGVDLDESVATIQAAQEAAFESAEMQDVDEDIVGEMGRQAYRIDAGNLALSQSMTSLGPEDSGSPPGMPPPPSERFAKNNAGSLHSPTSLGWSQNSASFAPLSMSQSGAQVVSANSASGMLTINRMSIWIDAEYLVRLKMRMEGVIEQDGESREIFLEREFGDYQTVPGTYLYEPYREVLRVGGLISPAQQAELQEAAKKLDEYERQLASMPASQRAMMEKMMGSKMDQFRSMANGGAVEMELITTSIVINPDFGSPIPGATSMIAESNLVQTIQRHLVTLGYDPGRADGELTKQTVIAITKFEAANSMPVTGKATVELVAALEASIRAQQ